MAGPGVEVGEIGQALDRAQADAQRPGRGVAVPQGRGHVPHAQAGVDRDQVDAGLRAVPVDTQQQ